jgi:hypothetical protein
VAVYSHGLAVAVATEIDRQDSFAIGDVLTTALEEEIRLLDHGLALAGNSAAKLELVARKVNLASQLNDSRINRHFGR